MLWLKRTASFYKNEIFLNFAHGLLWDRYHFVCDASITWGDNANNYGFWRLQINLSVLDANLEESLGKFREAYIDKHDDRRRFSVLFLGTIVFRILGHYCA